MVQILRPLDSVLVFCNIPIFVSEPFFGRFWGLLNVRVTTAVSLGEIVWIVEEMGVPGTNWFLKADKNVIMLEVDIRVSFLGDHDMLNCPIALFSQFFEVF